MKKRGNDMYFQEKELKRLTSNYGDYLGIYLTALGVGFGIGIALT